MKTKLFAALLLAAFAMFGCEDYIIDSHPGEYPYVLILELVDQNGENLLQETSTGPIEGAIGNASVVQYGEHKTRMVYPLNDRQNGINYFVCQVFISANSVENCPNKVVWEIKSKTIFGDDNERVIESDWRIINDGLRVECTSFEFEGKTYVPELKNEYWTARVVVNR